MPENVVTAEMTQQMLSTMNVVPPDKLKPMYRKYKDQGYEHFFMLNVMGFKIPTANRKYSHFEEKYILETIVVDADTSGSAVAGAAVTLPVDDPYDTDGNYYPRLFDEYLVEGPSGDVVMIVVGITEGVGTLDLTVVPSDKTKSIPDLTEGQEIMILGNTHSEGGGQPDGRQSKVEEFYNELKIIKETKGATGSSITDSTWFDMYKMETIAPLPNGETWGYYRKALIDLDHEMACWLSGALLYGEIVDNPLAIDSTNKNRTLYGTKGLFTDTAVRGHKYGYTPSFLSIADFDAWNFIYEQEYSFETEVMLYFATELYNEIQNELTEYGRYTDMSLVTASRKSMSDQYFGGKEHWEMSVGFEYFNKSGRTYMLKKLSTFSNVKQYGAPGYSKTKSGIILPMMYEKDPQTGQELPVMGYRYKELGGYNREYEIWTNGAAGGQTHIRYQGDKDKIYHYVRSEVGAQQVVVNRNIMVLPN